MLFAAGNPLDLEQQQVAGCCPGPGGRHSGLRRGLRVTSSGGTGGAASGSWAPFVPGGPWLHFVSNDKAAVDRPPSSRGNRIHDTLAVGVSLGAAGFGARRAGRAGGSLGTERNQGHTLISAQRRGAASSHEVHEETLGRLGGITVGKEGLPAPQPRVFTPGPSRGQRRSCPQSPGWPLETLVQRRRAVPSSPAPRAPAPCPPPPQAAPASPRASRMAPIGFDLFPSQQT